MRHAGPGLQGWTEWLVGKLSCDCTHGWSGKVRHLVLGKDPNFWALSEAEEQHAIKILSELLDQYFADREGTPAVGSGAVRREVAQGADRGGQREQSRDGEHGGQRPHGGSDAEGRRECSADRRAEGSRAEDEEA
jgi:hypothetical protein